MMKLKNSDPYNIKKIRISVIGLGYVGLPLAIEFGKKFHVTGYDKNYLRVSELKLGIDRTGEILEEEFAKSKNLIITNNVDALSKANIYIITVPTPVNNKNIPDLRYIKNATKTVANFLSKNDIVIYESTVYPGCTEEFCVLF